MSNSAKHEAMNSGQAEKGLFSTSVVQSFQGIVTPGANEMHDVARGVKHLGRRGGNGGGRNRGTRACGGG